jgi:hypothetical protein
MVPSDLNCSVRMPKRPPARRCACRAELPLLHRVRRSPIDAERKRLEHPHLAHLPIAVDHGLDDDQAGDTVLAGLRGIDRFDAADDDGRLHVATDAVRRRGLLSKCNRGGDDDQQQNEESHAREYATECAT